MGIGVSYATDLFLVGNAPALPRLYSITRRNNSRSRYPRNGRSTAWNWLGKTTLFVGLREPTERRLRLHG
jgi:hypothetical protein